MDRVDFLLCCDVEEFNKEIEKMEIGDLVHMIEYLQTEMTCEQENFNELSAHLATIDDPASEDGQTLSARMIESQTRLTDLVSRNMKCFMLQSMSQGEGDLAGMTEAVEDMPPGPEAEVDECNGAVHQDDETEFVESQPNIHNWRPESEGVEALADISEEGHSHLDRHSRDDYQTSSAVLFPWKQTSTRAHRDEELHSGRFVFRASHEVDDVGRLNANIEEYESVARSGSVAHRELTHTAPDWDNAESALTNQSATCVFDSRNVDSRNHVTNRVVMNHFGPEMRSDSSTDEYHQVAITNGYHSNHKNNGEGDDSTDTRVSFTDLRSRFETEKSCDRVVKRSFSATKVNHTHIAVSTLSLKLQNQNESEKAAGENIPPVTDSVNDNGTSHVIQNSADDNETIEGEPGMNVVGRCSVENTPLVTLCSVPANGSHPPEGEWGATELREGGDSPHMSESIGLDSNTDNGGVESRMYNTGVSVDSYTHETDVSIDSCINDVGVSVDSPTDDDHVRLERDIKVSTAKVVLSVSSVSERDDSDHKLRVESTSGVTSDQGTEEARELPNEAGEGVYEEEEGDIEGDGLQEGNVLLMGQETKKAPPPPTSEDHLTNNNVKRHAPAVPAATPVLLVPAVPGVPVVSDASEKHKEVLPLVEPSTDVLNDDIMTDDDKVKARVTLKDWEPRKLLEDLYGIHLMEDMTPGSSFINMEGYLEKLPLNKKKATLLKTWKRRYFKAFNGKLYYFETKPKDIDFTADEDILGFKTSALGEKANSYFQLMGGKVEDLGNRILGVDDGRGRYLLVRCPTAKEFVNWKKSLESQTSGNISISYVKPVLAASPHKKQVIVIDIGSCSVRAGVLRQQPSLPDVFFPTVAAVHKESGTETFGIEALSTKARTEGNLVFPVRPSVRIDQASIAIHLMPGLIRKVFADLKVDPTQHWVMMSMPANLSDKMKEQLMDIFVKEFQVKGVNMVNQSVLALYSYNTRSGIIVDIGERLEIVPITDGYIVEGGVTRQPYGGHRVSDALNSCLTQCKYAFFSEVEFFLVRLAMEKLCFVTNDYLETMRKYHINEAHFSDSVDLAKYDLPEGSWTNIRTDVGRFQCPEGLFDPELWGMDNASVQKLVQKAVQACPMDTRREMWRSVYLSGGATQVPGFIDRLQLELNKFVPSSIVVEVHASPHRYHAAYIGACTLASLDVFQQSCISATQWQREGPASLRKWHMY